MLNNIVLPLGIKLTAVLNFSSLCLEHFGLIFAFQIYNSKYLFIKEGDNFERKPIKEHIKH